APSAPTLLHGLGAVGERRERHDELALVMTLQPRQCASAACASRRRSCALRFLSIVSETPGCSSARRRKACRGSLITWSSCVATTVAERGPFSSNASSPK